MLDEKYCIKVDEYNYTLCKIRKNKNKDKNNGEDYYTPVGYFNTLIQALERYSKEIIRGELKSGCICLSEAVKIISDTANIVKGTIERSVPSVKVTIE